MEIMYALSLGTEFEVETADEDSHGDEGGHGVSHFQVELVVTSLAEHHLVIICFFFFDQHHVLD